MKRAVVVGGSNGIGLSIALELSDRYDVTIIDKNPRILESITNTFDIMGIEGNGASFNTQEEAGN